MENYEVLRPKAAAEIEYLNEVYAGEEARIEEVVEEGLMDIYSSLLNLKMYP